MKRNPFEYFASGTNEPGQIWGFARIGHPLGVAADQCMDRRGCEEALLEVAKAFPRQRVFIDSGAFSEVEFRPGQGLVPVRPITDEQWRERLAFMQRIANAYGPRALLVAPDQVGDQRVTLERLARYREQVMEFARERSEIAVVLQGGDIGLADFEYLAAEALGWDGFVRAFPMKKGATDPAVLQDYLSHRQPRRVHLLGVGPLATGDKKSGRASAADLEAIFAALAPGTEVSWDSALIPAKVGRDKPGGRPLTRAQDIEAAEVVAEAFGSVGTREPFAELDYDWTEAEPYDYLGPSWGSEEVRRGRAAYAMKMNAANERRLRKAEDNYRTRALATAARAGLSALEAEEFMLDPNKFVHTADDEGNERWETDLVLANELERSFADWVLETSAQLRKERSIVTAFAPDQPEPAHEYQLLAPAIDPKSHRVIRGKQYPITVSESPDELLRRHPRPRPPAIGEQLKLLNPRDVRSRNSSAGATQNSTLAELKRRLKR
jgi:hypothetical protein